MTKCIAPRQSDFEWGEILETVRFVVDICVCFAFFWREECWSWMNKDEWKPFWLCVVFSMTARLPGSTNVRVLEVWRSRSVAERELTKGHLGPLEMNCLAKNASILMIHTSKNIYSSSWKRWAWSRWLILMRLVFVLQSKFWNKKLKSSQWKIAIWW